ncbi:hypothetical protein [Azospirillum thermophilum]|uniref:hypothetical protein n=1 Tax=Azospirillum thermophilum TaxID=2202148 RepID=UPI0011B3841C|nr:hypothetical protein [Azospirillum thermophilum]
MYEPDFTPFGDGDGEYAAIRIPGCAPIVVIRERVRGYSWFKCPAAIGGALVLVLNPNTRQYDVKGYC